MIQRSTRPRASDLPSVLWTLLIILAAIVGGLAAGTLVHLTSRWVSVLIPAAIGLAVALASGHGRLEQTEQGRGQRGAESSGASAASSSRSRAVGPPVREIAPGVEGEDPPGVAQLLRISSSPGTNRPWWEAAQEVPPQSPPEASAVPASDLTSYLTSALIAQCPRCGAFELDIRRGAARWTCKCESCEHAWNWTPGTAWPQVRVSPRRRKQHDRPAADTHNTQ